MSLDQSDSHPPFPKLCQHAPRELPISKTVLIGFWTNHMLIMHMANHMLTANMDVQGIYNVPIYTYFFGGNGSIGERSKVLDVAGLGVQSDDFCFVVSANMIAAYPMVFLPFQPTVPSSLG